MKLVNLVALCYNGFIIDLFRNYEDIEDYLNDRLLDKKFIKHLTQDGTKLDTRRFSVFPNLYINLSHIEDTSKPLYIAYSLHAGNPLVLNAIANTKDELVSMLSKLSGCGEKYSLKALRPLVDAFVYSENNVTQASLISHLNRIH